MIRFNIIRSRNLFHFKTPLELYQVNPNITVDLYGWTSVIKEKETGEIIILKKEEEDPAPFKITGYQKVPVNRLMNMINPVRINALVFQSSEDMIKFEKQIQYNIVEVSEDKLINYAMSSESESKYEALCKNSTVILYND